MQIEMHYDIVLVCFIILISNHASSGLPGLRPFAWVVEYKQVALESSASNISRLSASKSDKINVKI